jgi:signal transduction histidine kinase/ligand-binding sensor domain-containing protein/CheY-like chemotaxis protein/HPt (histidine-containing phosphotransfer) domain-containing protein
MHAVGSRSLIAAGLWSLFASVAAEAADAPALVLEHLTAAEGMPQGTVNVTLQDSQGFVWLGTEDGLVRYDGHELVRYGSSRTQAGGLPGNFIRDIAEDSHHDLWIAIKDAGLARWNRATDKFTVYRHDARDGASLASDVTRAVCVDARGRVWVGMVGAGIDVLDPQSGRIEHLRHDPANPDSLSDDDVFTVALDRSGALWAGTAAGLDRWQPEQRAFLHFRHDPADPHTLDGPRISHFLEDKSGNRWVASFDGGLNRMDAAGHVREHFRHDPRRATSLSSDDVRAVLEDHAGHLWVGTTEGLDLLDRSTGEFTHYRYDERDPDSLRASSILSLYEDQAGLVWIGTRAGGVSRWNPRSLELGAHRPDWLGGKIVDSFADAPDHKVWIASTGGLVKFDESTGEITAVDSIVGRRGALGDQRVMALRLDGRDNLWIGTMTSGLKRLSPNGELTSIPVKAGDARSLSAKGVMTIVESHSGRIWLGLYNGGANVLEPTSGLIRQLPFGSAAAGAISAASVTAIAEDLQGNMWLGTDGGGLDLARPDGTVIKVFRHDAHDPASLPSNTIYAIAVDAAGGVWIATDGGGIAHVVGSSASAADIHFQVTGREEGLSSDTIYGVLADSAGRIWLSSDAGLMRLDPKTQAVKTYHREHGLQGEEFEFGAFHRLRDGRFCFGGPGGFNIFDPMRLTENPHAPRVVLTGLEVLGAPVPSATPYWLADRLRVDYRASIVSLDLSALDFTSPKRNRLEYRIAGLSDRWIDLGAQRRVTLTNLDAGDHLLEVRAANADSVWSDPPLRLTIHRDAAPWRSAWAYAAYALLLLLFVLDRFRRHRANIRRIVESRQRLETEVESRTRELLDSNRRLAEAAQAKSNFLARISHELRTPMNGVVGMTELLARTALSQAQARLTQTISSSAHIMLQIVNDLLDIAKLQAGKVELESLPLDLASVLEECATLFVGAAQVKGIELTVCPPLPDAPQLRGDPLRVRQILMNLVGNAVKFTMQGGVIVKADVGTVESGRATVQITVADTGVGMDAAAIAKIFEPFTQADESTTRRFGGSGLGLAICRELAERMGGTISVESRPNVGSTFHLCLPLEASEAAATRLPVPFSQRRVRILTRQPALAQALARHVSALGLSVVADGHDLPMPGAAGAGAGAGAEILVADLTTHASVVESAQAQAAAMRPMLVIVGTDAQIEALQPKQSIDSRCIVPKPVQREVLYAALQAAAGLGGAPPCAASNSDRDAMRIGAHVLLVEDEPVNAAVARGYLSELGCTAVWVQNGPEAVARCATERFDLIMMDLNMPLMDGFRAAALIRQGEGPQQRTPIIALTAHEAKNYRDSCRAAGMDDIMSKPYSLQQCAELLRQWIKRESPSNVEVLTRVDATAVAGLQNLRGAGRVDLYTELVDLFQAASREAVAQLEAALRADDLVAARAVCHKFASSAANVGALVFARDLRRLDKICEQGDHAAARQLCDTLVAALPALIDELLRRQIRQSA